MQVGEKREQSQLKTKIWKQTCAVVGWVFKTELLDNGVNHEQAKDFLFKVFITLGLKCNLFPTDVLLISRMVFWKEETLKNVF